MSEVAGGFTLLHHPRYAPPAVRTDRGLVTSVADSADFDAILVGAGMRKSKGWWSARGRPIARLLGNVPGRVEVEFSDLRPEMVASLPQAGQADVFPVFDAPPKSKAKSITRAHAIARRKEVAGCVAVLGDRRLAADLVIRVVVTCHSEG